MQILLLERAYEREKKNEKYEKIFSTDNVYRHDLKHDCMR